MHVHFIAVSGTGMGALAGLFKALGHDVSGSDVNFDPPMGPALESWGIRLFKGFDPSHLCPAPDLVIVGNVCRKDNVEARAAIDSGLKYSDMAHALAEHVLSRCSPLVVAGTHGKTTTSAMCAYLLDALDKNPGFLIGGLPKNFPESFHVPTKKKLALLDQSPVSPQVATRRAPFVVEGDEYDTAFFEKTPKFWHYMPEVAIVTSIEHDHIDIYPSMDSYLNAFSEFVRKIPEYGLVIANAADKNVVDVVSANARCDIAWFALQGDELHGQSPHWLAAPAQADESGVGFDVFAGGVASGRFAISVPGLHNVRNALAAIAAVTQGFGASIDRVRGALAGFKGVRRRQDLLGTPRDVRVYDDFAHHPTAVDETLRALRVRHPKGSLFAVFEPRSATACRALHQQAYESAFDSADRVILAPLGRSTIDPKERLDLGKLAGALTQRGKNALAASSIDEIIQNLVAQAQPGDTIALLSNGAFGGIHKRLLEALSS
jgi:UDP-N-acetylmuramate: L-alanyl-gamma-D-glutamyl-meso-diaminopimelate ligase